MTGLSVTNGEDLEKIMKGPNMKIPIIDKQNTPHYILS
jgi:hypothetical protein